MRAEPDIITASTNRNLLQPTKNYRERRKSKIHDLRENVRQGEHRGSGSSSRSKAKSSIPIGGSLLRHESSESAVTVKSQNSQLVDLVVEDHQAEEIERVRARKEGGPGWNEVEQKHFVYVSRSLLYHSKDLPDQSIAKHIPTKANRKTYEKGSTRIGLTTSNARKRTT